MNDRFRHWFILVASGMLVLSLAACDLAGSPEFDNPLDPNNMAIDDIPFADDELAELVASEAQANGWKNAAEVREVRNIWFQNSVTSLEGLQFLVNLESLHVGTAGVDDLGPILNAPNLQEVELSQMLDDPSRLESLSELTRIRLIDSGISDIAWVTAHDNLTSLRLDGNEVSDLGPVAELTQLEVLAFRSNNVADLSPISGLHELYELVAHNNEIEDVEPLSDLTGLIHLRLSDNEIINVEPLASLTTTSDFSLDGNEIESGVASLVALENPNEIDLSGNDNIPQEDIDALLEAFGSDVVIPPE